MGCPYRIQLFWSACSSLLETQARCSKSLSVKFPGCQFHEIIWMSPASYSSTLDIFSEYRFSSKYWLLHGQQKLHLSNSTVHSPIILRLSLCTWLIRHLLHWTQRAWKKAKGLLVTDARWRVSSGRDSLYSAGMVNDLNNLQNEKKE